MSAIEAELGETVEDILGQGSIHREASLVDLGASSLSLMRLIARVHARYGVLVELDELFLGLSLAELADLIEQRRSPAALPLSKDPSPRPPRAGPLTEFQMPFWEARAFLPAKRAYNEPMAYIVDTELDRDRCRAVLETLVEEHPILRTAFVEDPGGLPVQRELPRAEIGPLIVEERDFSGETDPLAVCLAAAAELAKTDFELDKPPLFRAFAWRIGAGRWLVGCILYHIIMDLWSAQLLAREAARLYMGGSVDDPPESRRPQDAGEEDLLPRWDADDAAFWTEQLAGRPAPLAFPARPRPSIKSYRGGLVQRTLSHSYSGDIEPARRALGVTASSLTFAAFGLLLSSAAAAETLVVGVPYLLRERPESQNIVGMFLNTLPVRLHAYDGIPVGEFVRAAHAGLMAALSHASYPVHLMQEQAGVAPTLGRAPLYDHLFTFYEGLGEIPGASEISLPTGTSKLDLSCFVRRCGNMLNCRLEYSSDLFSPEDAADLLLGYETALNAIAKAPLMNLAEAKESVRRDHFTLG